MAIDSYTQFENRRLASAIEKATGTPIKTTLEKLNVPKTPVETKTEKKIVSTYKDAKGNTIAVYDDGTSEIIAKGTQKTIVSTYTDPKTGDVIAVYDDGTTSVISKGKAQGGTSSAYDLLFEQFSQYGLSALVEPLKQFIIEGVSPAELTLRLRNTDAYKKRFAANAQRIGKGLAALSEAEYIALEDQYQNIMRNYGLPASYYARGDMGRQEGFEKDRKSTRLNSSHVSESRMPSSA